MTFSRIFSSFITSAAATAAAHATAFPAYVPPNEPGFSLSVSSRRVMIALSGNPFARPFAESRMSGRTPEYSML